MKRHCFFWLVCCAPAALQAQQVIVETFVDTSHQDLSASCSLWGNNNAPGARPGLIGGDGRHGPFSTDLAFDTGQVIDGKRVFELDTDNTLIPPNNGSLPNAFTVTDGRYFFSKMVVPLDVRLRFVGFDPPILTGAGQLDVQGDIGCHASDGRRCECLLHASMVAMHSHLVM